MNLETKIICQFDQKINLKESHAIQFKEMKNYSSSKVVQDSLKYLIPFANRDGGMIIFGVNDLELCTGFTRLDDIKKKELEEKVQESFEKLTPPLKLNQDIFIEHHLVSGELQVIGVEVNSKKEWIAKSNVESYILKDGKVEAISHKDWWRRFQEILEFQDESNYSIVSTDKKTIQEAKLSDWIYTNYPKIANLFKMEESDCLIPILNIFIHNTIWNDPNNKKYLLSLIWKDEKWFKEERTKEMDNLKKLGSYYISFYCATKAIEEKGDIEPNYSTKEKFDLETFLAKGQNQMNIDDVFMMLIGCVIVYSKEKDSILKEFLK